MSDIYSLVAQMIIATQNKDAVRICRLMNYMGTEMESINLYMNTAVEEAKSFLTDYLSKIDGKTTEAMN